MNAKLNELDFNHCFDLKKLKLRMQLSKNKYLFTKGLMLIIKQTLPKNSFLISSKRNLIIKDNQTVIYYVLFYF